MKTFRTRTHGTKKQIGKVFPVLQKKKLPARISLNLPRRGGKVQNELAKKRLAKIRDVQGHVANIKSLIQKGTLDKETLDSLKEKLPERLRFLKAMKESTFIQYPNNYGETMTTIRAPGGEKFKKGDTVLEVKHDGQTIFLNPKSGNAYDQVYTKVELQVANKRAAKLLREMAGGLSFMSQSEKCPKCKTSTAEAARSFKSSAEAYEKAGGKISTTGKRLPPKITSMTKSQRDEELRFLFKRMWGFEPTKRDINVMRSMTNAFEGARKEMYKGVGGPPGGKISQLAIGAKIEIEHTKIKSRARKIAADHLKENPNYYRFLIPMEKAMRRIDPVKFKRVLKKLIKK